MRKGRLRAVQGDVPIAEKTLDTNRFQLIPRNLENSLPSAQLRFLLLCPRQPGINSTQQLCGSPCCVQGPDGALIFFIYLDVIFSVIE